MVIEGGGAAVDAVPRARSAGNGAPGSAAESLAILAGSGRKTAGKGKGGFPAALEAATVGAKAVLSKTLKTLGAKAGASASPAEDPAGALAAAMKNRAAKTAAGLASALDARAPAVAAVSGEHGGKAEKLAGKKKEAVARAGTQDGQTMLALLADSGRQVKGSDGAAADPGSDQKRVGQALPAEARGPVIRIVDLRTPDKHAARPGASAGAAATQLLTGDRDVSAMSVGKPVATRDTPPLGERLPAAPVAHSPLDRLREAAGPELLRAANLVLRDGGGEIRLVLKPESLGSVRIQMNLVDNKIDGRIIVDSSSVKHVFDANVDALRRALTAEGFQTGSLQVSVGGQGTGQDARKDQQPVRLARVASAVEGLQGSVPAADDVSLGDLLVNLFV